MINLQCVCGHQLKLPDKLAGQRIRCMTCNKIMRVPPPSQSARVEPETDLNASVLVQGSRACPGCGKVYPPSVLVCVECGLNVATGAQLYVSVEEPGRAAPEPSPGLMSRLLRMLGLGQPEQGEDEA